jgi:hypothetical protein
MLGILLIVRHFAIRPSESNPHLRSNAPFSLQIEAPEFTYQASFDTVRGQWVDVNIPFDRQALLTYFRNNLKTDLGLLERAVFELFYAGISAKLSFSCWGMPF